MATKNTTKTHSNEINLNLLIIVTLAAYVFLVLCFYWLAGEQLRLRESRGNLSLPVTDAGALELAQDTVVEQNFHTTIQRLERVGVQWGTYYRANSGTVAMELLRQSDGEMLAREEFDASAISEGQVLTMAVPGAVEPADGVGFTLRLRADSPSGAAAAAMLHSQAAGEGFTLQVNGEAVPGMLCFTAEGKDYIWTGLHYRELSITLGAVLALLLLTVWARYHNGRRSYVVNALIALKKYRFLMRQLVGRDFKTKYKRSVLGMFWSFLNPLLMMTVQYFMFSTIFRSDIPYFAAYLISGTVMFNFFSEACGMTLSAILGNAGLITKVYMPKYIYPITRTMSSVINLVISLIPLIAVCIASGVHIQKSVILSLFFFMCLILFSFGMGMLLCTSMVFFRDTQFLWGVLSMMWMYVTPLFYPESILPDNFKVVLRLNPLYHFLKNARLCILNGISPEPFAYFQCLMIALGMVLAGAFVFCRNQDKFVLYI